MTAQQAREIFMAQQQHGIKSVSSLSTVLSERYHVSPKAVRDIWKGRSWLGTTFDLWNDDDRPCRRSVGRPKGKKDSQPRQSKKIPRAEACRPLKVNKGELSELENFHVQGHITAETPNANIILNVRNTHIDGRGSNCFGTITSFYPLLPSFSVIYEAALSNEENLTLDPYFVTSSIATHLPLPNNQWIASNSSLIPN